MSETRLLELPQPVFSALTQAAAASGTTPAAWIAAQLSGGAIGSVPPVASPTDEQEISAANDRLDAHIVSLGHATGTDNTAVDADLIRAHEDDHAPAPPRNGR